MFNISRGQIFVYAAIALVLAVVGITSLRGQETPGPDLTATAGGGSGLTGAADNGASGQPGTTGGAADGLEITAGSRLLVVDVSGAVNRPGVYRFSEGARVIDAVRKAGGAARGAAVGSINRAARLADGQQVVLPLSAGTNGGGLGAGGTSGATVPDAVAADGAGAASGPISLGSATTEQLEQIDGIGPVTAGKIIEFRDSKGGLGSIEELDQVGGVGPVTMESLRSALQP